MSVQCVYQYICVCVLNHLLMYDFGVPRRNRGRITYCTNNLHEEQVGEYVARIHMHVGS